MQKMKIFLCSMVIAEAGLIAAGASPAARPTLDYAKAFEKSRLYAGPRTREHLEQLKSALAKNETRMGALRELIDFMGDYWKGSLTASYSDGSAKLRQDAGQVIGDAADDATILAAIHSSDPLLIFWGMNHFDRLKDHAASLSVLKEFAKNRDTTLRLRAVEVLRQNGESTFVQHLATTEKSPYVLDQILFVGQPAGAIAMNHRLCELLTDDDANVRKEIIGYIGNNWILGGGRATIVETSTPH